MMVAISLIGILIGIVSSIHGNEVRVASYTRVTSSAGVVATTSYPSTTLLQCAVQCLVDAQSDYFSHDYNSQSCSCASQLSDDATVTSSQSVYTSLPPCDVTSGFELLNVSTAGSCVCLKFYNETKSYLEAKEVCKQVRHIDLVLMHHF